MKKRSLCKVMLKIVILLFSVLLFGCWDYAEVEDRGYVLGIAIDMAEPLPRGQDDLEEYLSEREIEKMIPQYGEPKFAYTIQVPIVPQARMGPEGGGGDVEEDRTWDLTMTGNNFFEAQRQFATRLEYLPFYEHLQVVVINEEVARQGILPVLDLLLADHEMRRRTRVFITPGDAKSILDVVPRIDDYSSRYLERLPLGASRNSRILHETDLGQVAMSIHTGVDFGLPRVVATEDEIKNAGLALFREDKMIGWLGEVDTIWAKWVRDAVLGGTIVVDSPNEEAEIVVLEVVKANTKVRPRVADHQIIMDIEVDATFNLVEEVRYGKANIFNEDYLEEVEKLAKKRIEEEIKDTVSYVQEEYGADIFHFNVQMRRYEPDVWAKIENEWHDIFPQVMVNVNAETEIRLTGLMK
ncbi:Ger(x)C family spore germination protein [Serpentinicella sp. ANB-PHB4]|uniref:Ger(x)C family spore germination protein n=1 Tax=Serpentinicella sp. ANB-PHB4 TaxID=3074076 RepID=UPI0028643F94|nr:Ger(x)C family spore germination protein [Serpentinicella sp. ANB-PHB4]MDR5659443.1 Ger(x)C family spore germination protein [Serpentinicella sp. ANB-PHB4]